MQKSGMSLAAMANYGVLETDKFICCLTKEGQTRAQRSRLQHRGDT
jgi:hypothetical protein